MRQPLGTKLYYSIGEVAELTDLQPYTLRAWEKEFTCLRPRRVRGKNRAYRERDIGIIRLIKRLLYEERYSTRGVQQKLKAEPELVRSAADNVAIEPHGDGPTGDTAILQAPRLHSGTSTEQGEEARTGGSPAPSGPAAPPPAEGDLGQTSGLEDVAPPAALRALLAVVREDLREVLKKLS